MHAKFHHNIPHSSRDFHFFRIWSSAKPRPIKNVSSQSLGLDLVNINVYTNALQNLALGKASTDDKCHFAVPWARSFQHQIVCNILSKYSKSLRVKCHFFQNLNLGKTSTNSKCHLTVSWVTFCQYQCVCKMHITSQYSTQFKR